MKNIIIIAIITFAFITLYFYRKSNRQTTITPQQDQIAKIQKKRQQRELKQKLAEDQKNKSNISITEEENQAEVRIEQEPVVDIQQLRQDAISKFTQKTGVPDIYPQDFAVREQNNNFPGVETIIASNMQKNQFMRIISSKQAITSDDYDDVIRFIPVPLDEVEEVKKHGFSHPDLKDVKVYELDSKQAVLILHAKTKSSNKDIVISIESPQDAMPGFEKEIREKILKKSFN